jgi:DNA-directed RNA polymerase specialized sigma24 family protein
MGDHSEEGEMTDALLDRLHMLKTRPTLPSAWSIMTLWREGFNTADIAEQIGVAESEVANRLAHLREQSRHGA